MIGKQDPFIQFQHNGVLLKTKTAVDAGKHAKYTDELFTLEDLESAITKNEMITFNAMDEDAAGADLLAVSKPLSITSFLQSTEKQTLKLDFYDKKQKVAGDLLIQSKYFWNEPDQVPVARDEQAHPLNKKCKVQITIIEAKFLKDADTFGKMDPYLTFKYGRVTRQTKVAEDAGKHAIFNERFMLTNVKAEIENDAALVLKAMEKDMTSSDFLGAIKPIAWSHICSFDGTVRHDVEIFGEKGQKVGNVVFKT